MRIKSLLPAAIAGLIAAGPASATLYTFSQTGWYDDEDMVIDPDAILSGTFEAEDTDGNGVITYNMGVGYDDEITAFSGTFSHATLDVSPTFGFGLVDLIELVWELGTASIADGFVAGLDEGIVLDNGDQLHQSGYGPTFDVGGSIDDFVPLPEELVLTDESFMISAAAPVAPTLALLGLGLAGLAASRRRS